MLRELDGIRGVAVLLVVITHLQLLVPYEVTGIDRLDDLIAGSYLGVDLFFVLSGFLITALLLDEIVTSRNLRFRAFYARRGLRLLPALYVLLAAHVVYAVIADLSWFQEWATIRSALLYVSNWQLVYRPLTAVPDLGLLWSLAIEEQFYLLWPAALVLFFGPRQSARVVTGVLVATIVVVARWRAHLWRDGVFWAQLAVRTDTRVDSLLVGALLASLWVRGATPTRGVNTAGWVGLGTIVVCLATFDITEGTGYKGGLTLFAVAVSFVILALLGGTWPGRHLFDFAPLRAIGRVSYGLYLWHYPIFHVVSVEGQSWSNAQRVVVASTLTVLATVASRALIELPALRLKDRWRVARRRQTVDVPTSPIPPAPPPSTDLAPSDRRSLIAVGVVGVLLVAGVLRFTAFVGDPTDTFALVRPGGTEFPHGDVDRSGYWRLVDFVDVAQDDFDRADDPSSLGTAQSGQPWEASSGTWGIQSGMATVTDTSGGTGVALLPTQPREGLVEVTLAVATRDAGIVFRHVDGSNYWTVVPDPDDLEWEITEVVDGEPTTREHFRAPVFDGVTMTVTQSGSTIRVLVDGVEYYRLADPPPDEPTRSGLAATGPGAIGARWDRFLVMVDPTATDPP